MATVKDAESRALAGATTLSLTMTLLPEFLQQLLVDAVLSSTSNSEKLNELMRTVEDRIRWIFDQSNKALDYLEAPLPRLKDPIAAARTALKETEERLLPIDWRNDAVLEKSIIDGLSIRWGNIVSQRKQMRKELKDLQARRGLFARKSILNLKGEVGEWCSKVGRADELELPDLFDQEQKELIVKASGRWLQWKRIVDECVTPNQKVLSRLRESYVECITVGKVMGLLFLSGAIRRRLDKNVAEELSKRVLRWDATLRWEISRLVNTWAVKTLLDPKVGELWTLHDKIVDAATTLNRIPPVSINEELASKKEADVRGSHAWPAEVTPSPPPGPSAATIFLLKTVDGWTCYGEKWKFEKEPAEPRPSTKECLGILTRQPGKWVPATAIAKGARLDIKRVGPAISRIRRFFRIGREATGNHTGKELKRWSRQVALLDRGKEKSRAYCLNVEPISGGGFQLKVPMAKPGKALVSRKKSNKK